jgi:hypothetical protein
MRASAAASISALGEGFEDVVFERCGELRRAVGVLIDDTVEFGLGAGAVCAIPDGAQLAADGLAGGGAGAVVDGVAGEVELATLPERAREDGLAGGPNALSGGRHGRRW